MQPERGIDNAAGAATDSKADRVRQLVDEVIADSPVYVVEVDVRGQRGSQAVNIFLESDEELGVDDLAEISRQMEFLIDAEDLMEGSYHLSVSSPGVDRPLSLPRQYRKNIGRPLRVHYRKADGSGNTEVDGKLVAADEDGIDIEISAKDHRRIIFEDILWAKVKLPW